jgi:ATP-dependent DNA helicase RecQ
MGTPKRAWSKRAACAPPCAADAALYQELRVWRAEIADVAGIPVFMILTNRRLRGIVRLRPASMVALGGISGIGQARPQTYQSGRA